MLLSKDQILEAADLITEDVKCPEWGGSVRVRALSLKESNEWRRGLLRAVPKTDPKTRGIAWDYKFDESLAEQSNVRMLAIACIDEKGERLFEETDIEKLAGKNPAPIERLVKTVKRISGLDDKAIEEVEKNSEPNPNE